MSQEDFNHHCLKMVKGEIPYNPKFYVISKYKPPAPAQEGSGDPVKVVNPTELQVAQAKEQIKHDIQQEHINRAEMFPPKNQTRKRKASYSIPKKYKKIKL